MSGLSWVVVAALLFVTIGSNGVDPLHETGGRLRIIVPDLSSDEGTVRIYVHERETFVTENLKKTEDGTCLIYSVVDIENGVAQWTTGPLPHGEYAIIVHHDQNSDGVVNFGKLLPAEPIGYSNYDRSIAAYPDFDKARVTLDSPEREVRVDAFLQGRLFRKKLRE